MGGPWVQMALFCEKALQESDGVISPIRVVDRVFHSAMSPTPPAAMPPFPYQLTMVVALKAGEATGRSTVAIETESPDGITRAGPSFDVLWEAPDRGNNLIVGMQMVFEKEGLYWFNVLCDGQLLTRIPLRVVYRATTGSGIPSR
jgi:hypothetical protein